MRSAICPCPHAHVPHAGTSLKCRAVLRRYVRYFAAALAAWPPQQPLRLSSVRLAGRGVLKGSRLALVVRCCRTGAGTAEKVAVTAIGKEEGPLAEPCHLEQCALMHANAVAS
jgi:hypothetical protein